LFDQQKLVKTNLTIKLQLSIQIPVSYFEEQNSICKSTLKIFSSFVEKYGDSRQIVLSAKENYP
jgi:hypothetical protein